MAANLLPTRILVVDDDPGVLRAAARVLERDYEVHCAAAPAEALERAAASPPDLALLDVRMPGMDGFELRRRLAAAHPDLDVILMTGSMTEPDAHLIRAIEEGAFYFIPKPFDRRVLQTLVRRCLELRTFRSVARRELARLRIAQGRLLPQSAPAVPGYALSFRYEPFYYATGDYLGFFPRPDAGLGVFVGDGSGHGPSASMLMATVRALLHTMPGLHQQPPGQALRALGATFAGLVPPDLFMTAVYLLLETDGRVSWASAGQEPPLRMDAAGEIAPVDLDANGLPLGIDPDQAYQTVQWQLARGDRLFVFTDGIYEARDRAGREFGRPRLQGALRQLVRLPLDRITQGLVDRVKDYMEGSDFEDDFTLLAVERTG
jgi:sigma-B regulation protein RsbU (phosphoserine phosphatase)